jgi:hypothetical protein
MLANERLDGELDDPRTAVSLESRPKNLTESSLDVSEYIVCCCPHMGRARLAESALQDACRVTRMDECEKK